MITTDVQITGLRELDDALAQFSDKVAKKALDGASLAAINVIAKEARRIAPKSEQAYHRYMSSGQGESTYVLTKRGKLRRGKAKKAKAGEGVYTVQQPGLLRKSIQVRKLKQKELKSLGVDSAYVVYMKKNKKPKLTAYYWRFIEYGTSKLAPAPFLRPAFDTKAHEAIERFKAKLRENIEKEGGVIAGTGGNE